MPDFTGDETPADVVRMVIADFPTSALALELLTKLELSHQGDIPLLRFQFQVKNNLGEFVCQYRLDKMLLTVYPACEKMYDDTADQELLGNNDDPKGRGKFINHFAYTAMNTMLSRLLLQQVAMFDENFEDTMFLTAATFLTSLGYAYRSLGADGAAEAASGGVRTMLEERLKASAKKKRELLVSMLKRLPTLVIPTGVGRPKGSTKPATVKAREAAEFEKRVDEAIRKLISPKGKMPTKKAVAKELGIGGLTPNGTDSSLTNFSRKLKGLKLDYKAIVEKVKLDK